MHVTGITGDDIEYDVQMGGVEARAEENQLEQNLSRTRKISKENIYIG